MRELIKKPREPRKARINHDVLVVFGQILPLFSAPRAQSLAIGLAQWPVFHQSDDPIAHNRFDIDRIFCRDRQEVIGFFIVFLAKALGSFGLEE